MEFQSYRFSRKYFLQLNLNDPMLIMYRAELQTNDHLFACTVLLMLVITRVRRSYLFEKKYIYIKNH